MDLKGQHASLACTKRAQFGSQDHSKQLWLYSEPRIPASLRRWKQKNLLKLWELWFLLCPNQNFVPWRILQEPRCWKPPTLQPLLRSHDWNSTADALDVSAIVPGPNWWEMTAEAARSGLCPLWNFSASGGGRDSQGLTICDLAPDTERGEGKKRDSSSCLLVPDQRSYQQKID